MDNLGNRMFNLAPRDAEAFSRPMLFWLKKFLGFWLMPLPFCLLLIIAVRQGALKRPWLVSGLFGIGYGLARIASEFFREPDQQLGFLLGGATMGMLLSVPLVLLGLAMAIHALRKPPASNPPESPIA